MKHLFLHRLSTGFSMLLMNTSMLRVCSQDESTSRARSFHQLFVKCLAMLIVLTVSSRTIAGTVTPPTCGTINVPVDYPTIQAAIDVACPGAIIQVASGTYNEQISINKAITILGVGGTQPILNFTGTPGLANGHPTLVDISSSSVRIENLDFEVDMTKVSSAVLASAADVSSLTIINNTINPYRTGGYVGAFGNRNAISINYGGPTNYRVNGSISSGLLIQGNTVTYNDNATPAEASDDAAFRAGIATDEGGGSFTGNTLQATSADILVRFAQNGAISITNNNFNGFGLELAEFNPGATSLSITGNTFNGTFGSAFTSSLRLKNNISNIPTTVANNTFTGHNLGISLENYRTVTVNNNSFTPAANSTTFRHIVENTKEGSSSSGAFTPMVSLILTNNIFNGSGTTGGTGLAFYNQDNDSPVFGTFTLGTSGNENSFTSGLGTYIYLDGSTGAANPNATPVAPWSTDLNAINNKFDVGSGLKVPGDLTSVERATLETKLMHKPDNAALGLITYYLPVHNLTQNTYSPTIQNAVDAATAGDVIQADAGTYDELVTIPKSLTLQGAGTTSILTYTGPAITITGNPGDVTPTVIKVSAANVTIQNFALNVDLSKLRSAIHTSGSTPNLAILGNIITPSGIPGNNYGIRNAIAINPNLTNNGYTLDNAGFSGVAVKGNTVNVSASGIGNSFRAAVQMDLCGGTIGGSIPADGNTFTAINHDVNVRFSSQGPVTIQNNTSLGGGIQFSEPNAGGGPISIANNTLTGATVQPSTGVLNTGALMRLQNNGAGIAVSVTNNSFSTYRWGMSVENFNTLTLSGNSFTPLANSTDYRHISFNTKLLASTSATISPVTVGATLLNNTFTGSGAAGGTGIAFLNHRQDGASPLIGTYVLGQGGQENNFNAGIGTFLRLDNSTGPSTGFVSPFGDYTVSGASATPMNYWSPDLNAANNKFDVGSGLKLAGALSSSERTTLDGLLFDKNDDANVGRIIYYLDLMLTANPTSIVTTGTTTLSATVSGGTLPYSYTFSGPGTITPSGNTAVVSGLSVGVQTFTVIASDVTSPTPLTVSATVSVTVAPCNLNVSIGASPSLTIPANGTATLTASGATSYVWSTGATSASIAVNTGGVYSVTGTSGACSGMASVTLTGADLSPTIFLPEANFATVGTINNFLVKIFEVNGLPTTMGNVAVTITAPVGYTLSFDNTLTSIEVTGAPQDQNPAQINNPSWTVSNSIESRQISLLINPGQSIAAGSTMNLGFSITRTNASSGSTANITVNISDDATKAYDGLSTNNVYARIITGL